MNLFTVQLLLSLWCNLSTALSESADGGRPIYTCANAVTVGVRLIVMILVVIVLLLFRVLFVTAQLYMLD